MLTLVPCGRGNWHQVRLELPGVADMHLLNRRMWLELPGHDRREYWIRRVIG